MRAAQSTNRLRIRVRHSPSDERGEARSSERGGRWALPEQFPPITPRETPSTQSITGSRTGLPGYTPFRTLESLTTIVPFTMTKGMPVDGNPPI